MLSCRATDADLYSVNRASARLARADDKLATGKPGDAVITYTALIDEVELPPDLRVRALLGRARCRARLAEPSLARVDARIARSEAEDAFARDPERLASVRRQVDEVLAEIARGGPPAASADARAQSAPTAATPASNLAGGGPSVEPRSNWRAAGLLANHDAMTAIHRVTVHHTGTSFTTTDYGASAQAIRAIQRYHQDSRGWADIAYHYLIDRSGRIWEGRDIAVQGAHAGNSTLNQGNVGIAVLGNFEEQQLNDGQRRALFTLLDHLRGRFGIRSDQVVTHGEILRDSHEGGTACPGGSLSHAVTDYRRDHRRG